MTPLQILSFNKVIQIFKIWSENKLGHINSFGYGPIWDFGNSTEIKYPAMWVDLQTDSYLTILNRVIQPTYAFNILFCDQVNRQTNHNNLNGYESDNRQHIMSDCYQLITDFIKFIMNDLSVLGLSILPTVTTTKVEDETQDTICGWVIGIELNVKYFNCGLQAIQLLGDFNIDYNNDQNI